MSLVLKELKNFKKNLLLLLMFVCITTLCSMFLPMLMQVLIDSAIPTKNFGSVFRITGWMLVCVAVLLAAGIGTAKHSAAISTGMGHNLRDKAFEKVNSFSQQEIDTFSISSLITRSNTDVQNIQYFIQMSLSIAATAPVMCVVGIIMSLITSPQMSKILIVAIPAIVIIMAILGKLAIPLSHKIQEKLDRLNMITREKLTGTRVVRAFGTSDFEQARYAEENHAFTKLNKGNMRITGALTPCIAVVLSMTLALLFFYAVNLSIDGEANITQGEVLAMLNYIMYIISSVIMLAVVFILLPKASTSAKRVKEVLESENLIVEPQDGATEAVEAGCLEFRNVSFTYAGADCPAVKNLSFKAYPGQTTAIIGGTGMGKSTIINMIPRLYDCTEGEVLVDGINVKDWDLDELRQRIGFVPQKAVLFKGTIDSNLAFGGDDPSDEIIEEAVQIAQSYDFVMGKKQQFMEPVAQGGSNFSGGQKQRLCIARALVRKPDVYVFDDSFSALDFKTDKMLRAALKEHTQDATTVIVAQRVSTIMDADQIIVIDRGNIMGIGTHAELMESCDVYKEIVKSQMKEEVA